MMESPYILSSTDPTFVYTGIQTNLIFHDFHPLHYHTLGYSPTFSPKEKKAFHLQPFFLPQFQPFSKLKVLHTVEKYSKPNSCPNPMKPKNGSQWPRRSNFVQNLYIFLLFLFLKLFVLVQCSNNNSLTKSLDVILHEHAFNTLIHQHTGSLYNATVPSSLAGMKLTLVRLRSRTLWEKGANFSGFSIPPRTIPVPYVKRIHIVYNDMGNLSSHYFNISGYNLLTSVIGFIVYDAPSHISTITSLRKLDLRPMGQPISIEFKNLTEMIKGRTTKYCAMFDENGKVSLSDIRFPNLCYTRNHGHFTIVLPSETRKKKKRIWGFLVIGFVIGLLGVGLVAVAGRMVLGIYKSKKTCEMEREAEEGEILESVMVGRSKMPVAMVTRTHPVLEGLCFP